MAVYTFSYLGRSHQVVAKGAKIARARLAVQLRAEPNKFELLGRTGRNRNGNKPRKPGRCGIGYFPRIVNW